MVREYMMYPSSSLRLHCGERSSADGALDFQPANGGSDTRADVSHMPAMLMFTFFAVRSCGYSKALVTLQNRSRLTTTKLSVEAVHKNTSVASHTSQRTAPKAQ